MLRFFHKGLMSLNLYDRVPAGLYSGKADFNYERVIPISNDKGQ